MADVPDPTAEEIDAWLDSIEPNPADTRDGRHLRRIIAAVKNVQAADDELWAAVAVARAAGDTWDAIGLALDTTARTHTSASAVLVAEPKTMHVWMPDERLLCDHRATPARHTASTRTRRARPGSGWPPTFGA